MKVNQELIQQLDNMGLDMSFLIKESFLGYKYRKSNKKLRMSDANIPTKLIQMYYSLNSGDISFDKMKNAFVSHYVLNESRLEGVNDSDIHGKEEIKGFKKMYEYIHSPEIQDNFNVFTLKELHKRLFSYSPFPECAGNFRNYDVYLPGTGTELVEWSMIYPHLKELDDKVSFLKDYSKLVTDGGIEELLFYINQCVELNCQLIKVHPFGDGNGRTIRGFTNKLFEDVNLPPIYVKTNERTEYHKAMNLANNEGDYMGIQNFYRYKICDSIIELDINNRVKKEREGIEGRPEDSKEKAPKLKVKK